MFWIYILNYTSDDFNAFIYLLFGYKKKKNGQESPDFDAYMYMEPHITHTDDAHK